MFRPSGFGVSAGHLSNTLEGCFFFFRADGERKSVLVLNIPSSGVGRLRPARMPLLSQIPQTSSSCKDVQVKMSAYAKLRQHFGHVQILEVTSVFKCKRESPSLSFGLSWNVTPAHWAPASAIRNPYQSKISFEIVVVDILMNIEEFLMSYGCLK